MTPLKAIKNFLKRFLPPPTRAFNREVERILVAVGQSQQKVAALGDLLVQQQSELDALHQRLEGERNTRQREETEVLNQWRVTLSQVEQHILQVSVSLDQCQAQTTKQTTSLAEAIEQTRRQVIDGSRHADEAVWAQIFNNTITNSTWLHDKTFSPGRWAVGYPALYAIYRILNEVRPKRILELGLGQSTRMMGQYAAEHRGVEHIIVESGQEWVKFFLKEFDLSAQSSIIELELELATYKEATEVRMFKGFKEALTGQKFDFIFIDAPLGSDMKHYARIDVLNLLPELLNETFAIMVDDCDRVGELHMIRELEAILRASSIRYKKGRYVGSKACCLLASTNWEYLCSM